MDMQNKTQAAAQSERKQRIFSGVQPSGNLTIGNYLGAIKNWIALQEQYDCIYSVMDMHAITVTQDPATLRRRTLEIIAVYLAAGLDPNKCTLFVQSHVPAHAQLSWVLSCSTMFGELSRMTQFKDKSKKHADNINAGLFTYPVLMAADILLYSTELVPVGQDQKQHVELARNIAERFNTRYGDTFVVPQPLIQKSGAKIMSLASPDRKMSKSDENANAYVTILDKPDDIMRKFRRAVTDSDSRVCYADGKDGINNLMTIYSCFTGKSYEQIEAEFDGKGYGEFKASVGEACVEGLRPLQTEYQHLMADTSYLKDVARTGRERASAMAEHILRKVYKKVGFIQL